MRTSVPEFSRSLFYFAKKPKNSVSDSKIREFCTVSVLVLDLVFEFSDLFWPVLVLEVSDLFWPVLVLEVSDPFRRFSPNTICEGLRMQGESIYFIPKGIDKFFPQLKSLAVENSRHLKKISQSDLKPFTQLTELSFHNNVWKN